MTKNSSPADSDAPFRTSVPPLSGASYTKVSAARPLLRAIISEINEFLVARGDIIRLELQEGAEVKSALLAVYLGTTEGTIHLPVRFEGHSIVTIDGRTAYVAGVGGPSLLAHTIFKAVERCKTESVVADQAAE